MAGFRIEGDTSGVVAEVDANHNLKVRNPIVPEEYGGTGIAAINDSGSVTGTPSVKDAFITDDYRLNVSQDVPLFHNAFNAAAQNSGQWKHTFTTMTCTQGAGLVTFNANSTLTATTGCALQSWQYFPLLGTGSLRTRIIGNITQTPLANQIVEFGHFVATTTTAPVEGTWYQFTSAGLIGVVNFNGTPTTTGTLLSTGEFTANQNYTFDILIGTRDVEFWRDDIFLGRITVPAGNGTPFMTQSLPLCMQFRNGALVSGSPVMQLRIADCSVDAVDYNYAATPLQIQGYMGLHATQVPSGGTMGGSAALTNAATAAAAALTNTTALITGFGGVAHILPTLTAGTDGIVCGYQVPAGTVNITPRNLMITRVTIDTAVDLVLAGGPLVLVWSLGYGSTSLTLVTTETASFANNTTKVARRMPLGIQSCIAAAVAGTAMNQIDIDLASPIVVHPGEFIQIIARNLGTVTTTGSIVSTISIGGVWF